MSQNSKCHSYIYDTCGMAKNYKPSMNLLSMGIPICPLYYFYKQETLNGTYKNLKHIQGLNILPFNTTSVNISKQFFFI